MLLVARVDSRRVMLLGVAGLVPAALVTLLLVHQPSIGARRLYPMLRGSIALLGLCLAVATLITWASSPYRFSRSSLCGLAWAAVTVLLCIGPLLESTPRPRLYALELDTGDVVWASSRAAEAPNFVDGELVVTETKAGSCVGLDPQTGRERWRHDIGGAGCAATATPGRIIVVDGQVGPTSKSWSMELPGEAALAVTEAGDGAYAYVSAPGANGVQGGAIVKFDVRDGALVWRRALPAVVASGSPAIDANGAVVIVAGGERIGALDADDGTLQWTQSVVDLGKSRGYALPGAVHHVIVSDALVFLSATPDT